MDKSNGYEALARKLNPWKREPSLGPDILREWTSDLPPGASVLDLGCGTGIPISQTLVELGFRVHGIDASPAMLSTFRANLPDVPTECSAVEDSTFFGRTFDAIVAWGLLFLLPPETQKLVIGKAARALRPSGRFIFTSPRQAYTWLDSMTGLTSVSLGYDAYKLELEAAGFQLVGDRRDAGDNFYYLSVLTGHVVEEGHL